MFKSLNEYYGFLEKDNAPTFDIRISGKLSALLGKVENIKEKRLISYEISFNALGFKKGKIPKNSMDERYYPDINLFLEYIRSRAHSKDVKNPKYKAKYNHLIWESPNKHIDFAKRAIDNYFLFLKSINLSPKDKLSNRGFKMVFENVFVLSQTVNYKKDDLLEFLTQNLKINKLSGYQKYSLMLFILQEGKKTNKGYLETFYGYSRNVIDKDLHPDFKKEYTTLLIQISVKLGKSPKEYQNKLGDTYIAESEKHKESFAVHDFYLKALKQYQQAGNKEKVEEVAVLIENAKGNLNFKPIKLEKSIPELQKWYNNIDEFTTNLIDKEESKSIYGYLMLSDRIFPKADVLEENMKSVMMELVSTMSFDINRNLSGTDSGGINSYFIHIQNLSIPHLRLIFYKGLKNGKINYTSLKDFLIHNTWYGKDDFIVNPEGEKEVFRWVDLLLPAFDSYFQQAEIDIKTNKNNNKGYILSIDSLAIKFEGVVREFSRRVGAQTIDIGRNRNSTKERISIDDLLDNEKLKKVVPKDDIALFKFLFTSMGMNLRNNIAHCFYKPKNYSASIMWLLICAFLKLGNYTFKIKTG